MRATGRGHARPAGRRVGFCTTKGGRGPGRPALQRVTGRGERQIVRCTPHTLRRTFASILAEVNVPPRRAMYLLGHTDPTLTMRVYQQVIDMAQGGVEALEDVIGCTLGEAFDVLSGRGIVSTNCPPTEKNASPPRLSRGPKGVETAH
jgi:integrase-like protein